MPRARLVPLSVRAYRLVLQIYPKEHRRAYGPWMVQLFRDLARDADQRNGAMGVLQLWIRTLWDVVLTVPAERLRSGSLHWSNQPVTPLPWGQVLLGMLPGLLAVGCRSGWARITFGYRLSEQMYRYGLPMVCLALVLVGWGAGRKLAAWSFPALGLLYYYLPAAVAGLVPSSLRIPTWFVNGWLVVSAVLGIALVVRQRRRLHVPTRAWLLVGLLLLCDPLALLEVAFLLAPLALGLRLARRDKLLPILVIAAAQYWLVDEIYDPSYAMLMWSSNYTAERVVSLLPALSFLILTPVCVWRARSSLQRTGGLLLPPLIGLLTGETIRAIVDSRPYYLAMMGYIRVSGALGFVITLALVVLLYLGFEDSSVTRGGGSTKGLVLEPPNGEERLKAVTANRCASPTAG